MNGYNNGIGMVCELLNNCDIISVQEVWLKLVNVIDLFDGCMFSSMEEGDSEAIRFGRPFGGIGCIWRKSLVDKIKCVGISEMNACVCMHVNIGLNEFIIFNVYLPCNSDMLYEEFENRIIKVAGFIERCLEKIIPVGNKYIVIVCGDFNASLTKLVTDRRYAMLSKVLNEVELYAYDEKDVIGLDYTFFYKV